VDTSVIDYIRKNRREEKIINREKSSKISESKNLNNRDIRQENLSGEIVHDKINLLLKSRQRVVKLFFLGLSIEEISICLDWSQHKTRNLLYRGLADLRELIKSEVGRNE
jgi:RNA polymerase sigma-70 factor (ECF subfamily)